MYSFILVPIISIKKFNFDLKIGPILHFYVGILLKFVQESTLFFGPKLTCFVNYLTNIMSFKPLNITIWIGKEQRQFKP